VTPLGSTTGIKGIEGVNYQVLQGEGHAPSLDAIMELVDRYSVH
jgi:hypothetical protein